MFGRLPMLHQVLVVAIGLAVGVLTGLWIAHFTDLRMALSVGGFLGGSAGLLLAFALVHDFHEPHDPGDGHAGGDRRLRVLRVRRR